MRTTDERTPLFVVCGHGFSEEVAQSLLTSETSVVAYDRVGAEIRRRVTTSRGGRRRSVDTALPCHTEVSRIVVRLSPQMSPRTVRTAIDTAHVSLIDGTVLAVAEIVEMRAVITCIDTDVWLSEALDDTPAHGRPSDSERVIEQAEAANPVTRNRCCWVIPH